MIFVEFVAQGPDGDAQHVGRPGTVTAAMAERFHDELFFRLADRHSGLKSSPVVPAEIDRRSKLKYVGPDLAGPGEHNRPFDGIFKLPDIARPGMAHEGVQAPLGKTLDAEPVLLVIALQEMVGKARNILAPVAQCRKMDSHHIQAIVEVLPEIAPADLLLELSG